VPPHDGAAATPRGSRRVLILFAHPALHKSRVHRRLGEAVRDLPGVTFHDLYVMFQHPPY
jgi:glutathione-regulated potassium-efflux system ancillary protein KefG